MQDTEILLAIKLQQQLFVDPKRIRLLKEIELCGSINQAAKNANVSYKSAWDHLEAMNKIAPKPLLERNIGGKNGGGTLLTTYGKRVLQLYDLLEKTQEKAFHILQDENVPLDSLLSATASFSLQSSARNQFVGKIVQLNPKHIHCFVDIQIEGLPHPLRVCITAKSAVRLQLVLGKEVLLMIKAPWLEILPNTTEKQGEQNFFIGEVTHIVREQERQEVTFKINHQLECCAVAPYTQPLHIGQQVGLYIDPSKILLATLI